MKKYMVVFLIITISLFVVGCSKGGGQWVLVDTEFNGDEWEARLVEANASKDGVTRFTKNEAEVSEGSFTWIHTYIGKDGSDKQAHAFPGNTTITKGIWTEPPEIVAGPKYEVSMRIKIDVLDRHPDHPMQAGYSFDAEVAIPDEDGGIIHSYLYDDDKESSFYPCISNDLAPIDTIAYGSLEKGEREGERRALEVRLGGGDPLMSYIYEWQE